MIALNQKREDNFQNKLQIFATVKYYKQGGIWSLQNWTLNIFIL